MRKTDGKIVARDLSLSENIAGHMLTPEAARKTIVKLMNVIHNMLRKKKLLQKVISNNTSRSS